MFCLALLGLKMCRQHALQCCCAECKALPCWWFGEQRLEDQPDALCILRYLSLYLDSFIWPVSQLRSVASTLQGLPAAAGCCGAIDGAAC
jgi:predicted neuraminidase